MAVESIPSAPQRKLGLLSRLRRSERFQLGALLFPGLFWLILFFAVPLVVIVVYSFMTSGKTGSPELPFTLVSYITLFTKELYVNAYLRSIWIAIVATVVCLLIGYPLALFVVQRTPRWRSVLLFLILIPFWTNFLVRTYAWMIILNNNGLLNSLIQAFGLPRQPLFPSTGAVLMGLIYGELPFMVLPIYASLDRFDFTLLEAAADLGASRTRAFLRVMLPLTMPGVAAGSVLVFIPTVGQFVVSDLLGGAKVDMLGNLMERLFRRQNPPDWPLGSAMALVFMLVLTVLVIFYFRVTTEDDR
jgi:spermidine/putrescine transport system permease protein